MAKGDQSVPVPDLPSFFGNAKESARQAEKELKRLQATMRQAVREGKQLEPQLIRRVNELEGIKQRAQEITQQVKDVKRLDKQAKIFAGIATAQRVKDLLSGDKGIANIAAQIVTDPQILEKASKVLAKSMPKLAGALGNVAPYASIAGVVAQSVFDDLERGSKLSQTAAEAIGANIDRARAGGLSGEMRREEERIIREEILGPRAAQEMDQQKLAAFEKEVQDALTARLKRYEQAAKHVKAVTGLDAQTLLDMGKDPMEEAAKALFIGGRDVENRLDMAIRQSENDRVQADEERKRMRDPAYRYQKRETERQLEIMFQRRRSRVPDVVYD